MRGLLLGLVVAIVGILAWMSFFTVDPTEFVYLTEFGRHVGTFDGGATETDAGLHARWPWPVQTVRRLDRRLQHFDLPSIELLTREGEGGADGRGAGSGIDKTLTVEAYVCWRIADKDAVDRFVRRIDTPDRARAILGQRVNSQLGAFVGQMHMDDLISTEMTSDNGTQTLTKVDRNMDLLRKRLLDSLQKSVLDEYGIKLIDIRLRRFNHPIKVRDSIFARIVSERRQISARYESEGMKKASDIASMTATKVELFMKSAEKAERQAKAEAEKEAELIRLAAYSQDPKFFKFWNEIDQMRSLLGSGKTTLLLSTQHPAFDFLFRPPNMQAPGGDQPGPQKKDRP
jgi:membrane protease subunit HflC